MKIWINDFLLLLQFLTRIPINKSLHCHPENFKRSALFLPIIGLIIGALMWITQFLLMHLLPEQIVAIFVVLVGIMLTGALHLDGLADTCDGFFAFKGKDRIIEIMKDSRIGTFGGTGLLMDILIKVVALTYILENEITLIIILIPVLGRFSISFSSLIGQPAKPNGSGNLFIGNMSNLIVFFAAIITFFTGFLLVGLFISVALMSATIIISSLVVVLSNKKISGLVGDVLGAINELVEMGTLLTIIAIHSQILTI